MGLTRTFAEIGKGDAGTAGGKGASLGEMTQAGIPVPPGFVILTDAFEQFLQEADLAQELDAILDGVNREDIASVDHASEKIQALILAAQMPADIAAEIQGQFIALGAQYVAVRSSATAEDGAAAAWAGQLDTFLNTTEDTLLEKVQHCWASLFTPRAIFYRFEKGMHGQHISVAVVVQKMVQSEVSGIAFSVHPVTEDHNQLIIEAGYGLGEAIVSGQVTPDAYVVEKEPRRIIDANASTQTRGIFRAEGGGNEWRNIPEPRASAQVLNDAQILELSDMIIRIEQHYGFPCDIEWAFENGTFYITQSRPITTLNNSALEPVSSLAGKMRAEVTRHYVPLISDLFVSAYADSANYKKLFLQDYYVRVGYLSGKYYYGPESREFGEVMFSRDQREPGFLLRVFDNIYAIGEDLLAYSERIHDTDYTQIPAAEQMRIFSDFTERYRVFALSLLGFHLQYAIERAVRQLAAGTPHPDEAIAVLTFPRKKNIAALEQEDLLRIGVMIGTLSPASFELLPGHIQEEIQQHIARYGWINTRGGIGEPWSLEEVFARIRSAGPEFAEKIEAVAVHDRDAQQRSDALVAELAGNDEHASRLIDTAKELVYYRTYRTDYLNKVFFNVRNLLTAIAQAKGVSFDDLLHMTVDEIKSPMIVAPSEIERRKRDYALFTVALGETACTSDPDEMRRFFETYCEASSLGDGGIRGNVAYGGVVQARARIVITKADISKVRDGDVMVSPMTTPDMVPAMSRAAGFVTDEGGITCHAAIVSREMKKPCIIGTKIATQVLKDGDLVEVDADKGEVRVIKQAHGAEESDIKAYLGITDDWYRSIARPNLVLDATVFLDIYRDGILHNAKRGFEHQILLYKNGFSIFYRSKGQIDDLLKTDLLEAARDVDAIREYRKRGLAAFDMADRCIEDIASVKTFDDLKVFGLRVIEAMHASIRYGTLAPYWIMGAVDAAGFTREDPGEFAHVFAEFDILRADSRNVNMRELVYEKMWPIAAAQFGLDDPQLLSSLTWREFKTMLEETVIPDVSELQRRRDGCMVWLPPHSQEYAYSFDAGMYDNIFRLDAKETDAKELRGSIAQKGSVTGRVKILFTNADGAGFQDGDIVVSTSTSPNLMPFLMRCGGIVTDEGGIASHAAIVSRELKKPCIIGTKIATQVLKDGDLVEVDADKGVVRIVERA